MNQHLFTFLVFCAAPSSPSVTRLQTGARSTKKGAWPRRVTAARGCETCPGYLPILYLASPDDIFTRYEFFAADTRRRT